MAPIFHPDSTSGEISQSDSMIRAPDHVSDVPCSPIFRIAEDGDAGPGPARKSVLDDAIRGPALATCQRCHRGHTGPECNTCRRPRARLPALCLCAALGEVDQIRSLGPYATNFSRLLPGLWGQRLPGHVLCQCLIARAVSGVTRLSGKSARFSGVSSGSSIRSQRKKSKITWSLRLFSTKFVPVAPRQCLYELRLLEFTLNFGAGKAIQHGGQLAEVARRRKRMRVFRPKHAMSFQCAVSSCVISSTASQSIRRTFPWRTNFRSQWSVVGSLAQVLRSAVPKTMCAACFCSHSAATMRRARRVLPVPGKPVRSKEPAMLSFEKTFNVVGPAARLVV